jgi:glycosyltransferase involved in cell wall biosynthesis
LPGTAVSTLPNGVDVSAWRIRPEPRDAGDVLAVAVMRLASRKRPLQLLRILRTARQLMSPQVRFRAVIIGEGPQRASMDRYLRRHGMSSYVEMRGRQGRDQIRALYAHADMFVAPAQLESFGIAALEARCAGLPVVAMAASGIRDVIRSGQEGLLVDTDEQMAEAIVRLASSSRTRLRIARHNHLVAPPFDWPETLHRTEREYERAAAILARPLPAELDRSCNDQDHLHRRSASSA